MTYTRAVLALTRDALASVPPLWRIAALAVTVAFWLGVGVVIVKFCQ